MKKWRKIIPVILCIFLLTGCGSSASSEESKTERPKSDCTNMTVKYAYYEDDEGDAAQFYVMADWQTDDNSQITYDVDNGTYQKEDGTVVAKQSIIRADENNPGWYMLELYDEEVTVHLYSKWKFFSDYKAEKIKINKILSPAQFVPKDKEKSSYELEFDADALTMDENGNWIWQIGTIDHGACMSYAKDGVSEKQEEFVVPRADSENPVSIDISWDEKQLKKPDQVFISLNLSYIGECKEIKNEIVGQSEVYTTDDGTQLVTIEYDDPNEPFHHVTIHIWNPNVNMDVDWSSGKANEYSFASCRVLTAYQGEVIDEKDETNAVVEGEKGEQLLGICSVRMGIYCPYDPTWNPAEEDK